ncbi:MAG TPA: AIR synthase related protein, partial [Acidimicrobiales bacterium]
MGSPKLGHTPPRAEDETLERIRQALGGGIEAFGLRDDAGHLEAPSAGSLVVSVDSVVEGIHVDLAFCSPNDVGWKALMGALSDLAAMGARPVGALVALCVPEGAGDGAMAVQVMEGVAEAGEAAGCPIIGGDLSSSGALMVSVTVMGDAEGAGVRRSGAL